MWRASLEEWLACYKVCTYGWSSHAMKTMRGGRGVSPTTLNLGARKGVGGRRNVPADLPTWKTRYPLCRRMGGPHSRYVWLQKILPPLAFETEDVPRVTIPTELSGPGAAYTQANAKTKKKTHIHASTNIWINDPSVQTIEVNTCQVVHTFSKNLEAI